MGMDGLTSLTYVLGANQLFWPMKIGWELTKGGSGFLCFIFLWHSFLILIVYNPVYLRG